ncbi:MAG: hypothetical protein KJZ73_04755 [Pseudorhodoplanes sp.]|nr:hypothetical protein [Pseudorhodoplanes sp.]MCQ3943409.1 hypothetical protein [Alphaproteobacteria bacterium]GIK79326.1 MAG: hypothetical protein BroJett024_04310 [Alphaproteobacteria bacterium]
MAGTRPRAILMTSSGQRHRHVARRLADVLDLMAIVIEEKPAAVAAADVRESQADQELVAAHFAERVVAEKRWLEDGSFPDVADRLELPCGGINTPETRAWLEQRKAGVLLLYGTRIVRPPILSLYPDCVVNMHLGLSPYYRGSATNFWPLVEGEPECVGVTFHIATPEVDAGPVLAQIRAPVEIDDNAQDIGTKAIAAAADVFGDVVRAFLAGTTNGQAQTGSGRVYRRRDFNANAVRRMRQNFASGMIADYLAEKTERDGARPIVALPGATP